MRPRARQLPLIERVLYSVAVALALVFLSADPGSVRAATGDIFEAELTAGAEVPTPGPEGATGTATLLSYSDRVEIWFELTVDGLEEGDVVTAAHIHEGEAGVAGDVVLALFSEPPAGEMTGSVLDFDPELQAELRANPMGYYVNIHTEAYPDGAVRGQLRLAGVPTGECTVTVEPGTVAVGDEFVISGNFGANAEVYLVSGEDAGLPEDAEPIATVPVGESSFSFTFTAEPGDEGTWTVWALIPATECGDSAALTITAARLPDAAMAAPVSRLPGVIVGMLWLAASLVLTVRRRDARAGLRGGLPPIRRR